ncbi:MAG TPA: hypothetical protein VNJ03_07110 [Vicinamibacterales bacterium]|nr:hypothetical protein [Vicinamibacterales bacterium]
MFHTPRIVTTLLLAANLAAAACSAKQPVAPGTLTTIESLVDALRGQQATVRVVEQLPRDSHPYFSVPATVVEVNGETVSVFRYARTSDADREAATIAPNGGGVGTSLVSWMGPPHFYKKDTLVVLYVGSAPTVTAALAAALGPQIAGR